MFNVLKNRLSPVTCGRHYLAPASVVLALALSLGGCVTPSQHSDFYAPTMPQADMTPPPADGAIYHTNRNITLFSDPKASRAGDILTIKLVENTKASKQSKTTTKKSDSADLGGVHIAGGRMTRKGNDVFSAGFDGARQFSGDGSSSESNSLNGSITVTVFKRLSNGNLMIRGEKWLNLNKGGEYIRIYGIVRRQDISPDNVVPSTKVANAHISYGGKGVIDDANTMGALAKFFNSPRTPY